MTASELLRAVYRVRAFERAAAHATDRAAERDHAPEPDAPAADAPAPHALAPHALVASTAVALALTSGERPDLLTLCAGAPGATLLRGLPPRDLARHRMDGDASGHPTRHALGLIGPVPSSGVSVAVAAGAALAFALRDEERIAVVVDRGSAIESGGWHEGFNVAAARGAPLVSVLLHDEPGARSRAARRRGDAYGVRAERIATDSAEEMALRLHSVLEATRNEGGARLAEIDPLPADAVARLETRVIESGEGRARVARWSAEADAEAQDAWRTPEAAA